MYISSAGRDHISSALTHLHILTNHLVMFSSPLFVVESPLKHIIPSTELVNVVCALVSYAPFSHSYLTITMYKVL
jgi:hypothetical protein